MDFCVRAKVDGFKEWNREKMDGFVILVWGMLQTMVTAVWTEPANDGGAWRGIDGMRRRCWCVWRRGIPKWFWKKQWREAENFTAGLVMSGRG